MSETAKLIELLTEQMQQQQRQMEQQMQQQQRQMQQQLKIQQEQMEMQREQHKLEMDRLSQMLLDKKPDVRLLKQEGETESIIIPSSAAIPPFVPFDPSTELWTVVS